MISEFGDVVQMHRMAWEMGQAVAGVQEMFAALERDLEDLRKALRDMQVDADDESE